MNTPQDLTPAATIAPAGEPVQPSVTLDTPIVRGSTVIDVVHLTRPTSTHLKGISLIELSQLHADAIAKLLPRITVPPLLAHEVAKLPAPDLMAFGLQVVSFLMTKSEKAAVDQQMAELNG